MTPCSFTALSKPGRRAILATWVFMAAQLGLSFATLYQNSVIRGYLGGTADDAALTQSDTITAAASFSLLAVLIIVYCINGRFLFLASRNAAAIKPDSAAITPGWAVGWYAVPIANLWMPFTAMKQTWTRTVSKDGDVPGWLMIWWLSWAAVNVLDRGLSQMSDPVTLPDFISFNRIVIVSGFLWLIPSYFFLRIIRALTQVKDNTADVFT